MSAMLPSSSPQKSAVPSADGARQRTSAQVISLPLIVIDCTRLIVAPEGVCERLILSPLLQGCEGFHCERSR